MDTHSSAIIVGQQLEIDTAFQAHSQRPLHTPEKDATTSSPPKSSSSEGNNRTDGAYVLSPPTTASESARLDVQHDLWAISLGGRLHITPLDPKKTYKVNSISLSLSLSKYSFPSPSVQSNPIRTLH